MRRWSGQTAGYSAILAGSFLLATLAGWLFPQIDNYAYDWMFLHHQPRLAPPRSILLVADEESLTAFHGMRHIRRTLAEALGRLAAAEPKVVAIDLILADRPDPEEDRELEIALRRLPRLVLPCELIPAGGRPRWEEPLPQFLRPEVAVGHVHALPGPGDSTCRRLRLEETAARQRHWALALEAYRLGAGGVIVESPQDLQIGALTIPARRADHRTLRIRYLPPLPDGESAIPRISFKQLAEDPRLAERFRDKTVFVGVTAQTAARDRLATPYDGGGTKTQGIEVHAHVFETLAQGQFLVSAPEMAALAFSLLLATAGVASFAFRGGWQAYSLAGLVLVAAHSVPYALFTRGVVMPYFGPVSAAWLSAVGAGSFQFVRVRRQLRKAEADKSRYQQAMHFVTHEMRTPLTAIQGSSELMGRYNLSEEKRKQIAGLINSESKRLARMIETFLSVERLSAGEMELKKETFAAGEITGACVERALPLAERKQIRIHLGALPEVTLTGDRELMEYAVYNLLTNAVKYSPAETEITISGRLDGDRLRLAVRDQGIGMDQQEVKKIFQKFYRTGKAVASGEAGTGIGLSIVEQIVTQHGGQIEVTSAPGQGSCFTVVLPARISAYTERL